MVDFEEERPAAAAAAAVGAVEKLADDVETAVAAAEVDAVDEERRSVVQAKGQNLRRKETAEDPKENK